MDMEIITLSKSGGERQASYDSSYMWSLKEKNYTNEFIHETEIDLQTQKTNLPLSKGRWGGIN